MANLLVFVGADRLRELLPEVVTGDTWVIGPHTLAIPQLERLDEHSWLFILSGTEAATRCIAVMRKPRFENKSFAGGAAIVVDRDITHLLTRLGCTAGPRGAAAWATPPRVVPPSDLDLLCYELGLDDDDDSVAPILPDDPRTTELRSAVWDDPISDDARMVYADYLEDRGDPRGELINLQIVRARSGDEPSDRERQLVRRIAADCAQPLTPYLVPDFELVRGFVAKCTVNDNPMPDAIKWHVAWRTVEDLSTTSFDLLVSPHVRARRVGLGGNQLAQLVDHPRPLPFESIVGIAPRGRSQRGVWLADISLDRVCTVGALSELRALSISPYPQHLGAIASIFRSPLGRQLAHLDAFVELQLAEGQRGVRPQEAQRWREAFDDARVPLLSIRFSPNTPLGRRSSGTEVLVALRRTTRTPHLIVQVDDVIDAESVTVTMRFVAQMARGVQHAELHDFGAPAAKIPERQRILVERMRAVFPQLLVHPPSAKPLAP